MATLPDDTGHELAFECRTCGTEFELEYYICPECGGFSVEQHW